MAPSHGRASISSRSTAASTIPTKPFAESWRVVLLLQQQPSGNERNNQSGRRRSTSEGRATRCLSSRALSAAHAIARLVEPLALLEFDGRRTGRRRRIVVGWHFIDDQPLVVTPAKWRANFVGGGVATVRWKGNVAEFVGTLDTDPAVVAAAINALLNAGATPRSLALRIPAGHVMSAADVTATRRGIVRFESR